MTDLKKLPIKPIGLDKLRPSPDRNVRSGHDGDIDALAAAVAACGLLQNLIVHPLEERGLYGVSAGARRLAALSKLRDDGVIGADFKVNCIVIDTDDALQASLAENVAREAMNPADEARAFRRLVESGKTHTEIAAAFGVTERHVKARERLGRLAEPVFVAFQRRELSIDQAQAFGVVEDADRQAVVFAAWSKAASWDRSAATIGRMMLETRVPARSRKAVFVGREAYEAAGGGVDEDLFGEEVYFTDEGLIDRLVDQKLEAAADAEIARGWKWAAVMVDPDYAIISRLGRVTPGEVELDEDDQKRVEEINDRLENDELDDDTFNALEAELEALDDKTRAYLPEQMAAAGVVVFLTHQGAIGVERGLQRPEDRAPEATPPKAATTDDDGEPADHGDDGAFDGDPSPIPPAPTRVVLTVGGGDRPDHGRDEARASRDPYSDALRTDLRKVLQGALQLAIAEDPALARDVLEFETVRRSQDRAGGFHEGILSLRGAICPPGFTLDGWTFDEDALDLPVNAIDTTVIAGEDVTAAFTAFRALPQSQRDALLAAAVASVTRAALPGDQGWNNDTGDWRTLRQATHRVAAAAKPEPRRIWTPTRDNFLGRVSKAILLDIVQETLGGDQARLLMGAKKGELVDFVHAAFNDAEAQSKLEAEARARLATWLPQPLRGVGVTGADDSAATSEGATAGGATPDRDTADAAPVGGGEAPANPLAAE